MESKTSNGFSKTTKIFGLIASITIISVPLFRVSNNTAITAEATIKNTEKIERVSEQVAELKIGQSLLRQTVEGMKRDTDNYRNRDN